MGARLSASLTRALEAQRLAAIEPRQAIEVATPALEAAVREEDWETAAVAARAVGLARRELLQPAEAERALRSAVDYAEQGGFAERSAEARLSLAVELITAGRPKAALPELEQATAVLGDAHAQIHNQLALVYERMGEYDAALTAAARALEIAQRDGDDALCSIVLCNRGITLAYRGELAAAEEDMRLSRELALRVGGDRLAALDRQHNLGWILTRRGRLPEALHQLDLAEAGIAQLDVPLAVYQVDRAEALLAAGLAAEARTVAAAAAEELEAAGHHAELAEALLLVARAGCTHAESAAPDAAAAVHTAAVTAKRAAARFAQQDRPGWAAAARSVQLRAELWGSASCEAVAAAMELVADLELRGLESEAADLRLRAGAAAAADGDETAAAQLLTPLAARRSGPRMAVKIPAWQAESELRRLRGDVTGALAAARASLRLAESQHRLVGAAELAAAMALHSRRIASMGLALASQRGPAAVLEWSERARSAGFDHPPMRPPDDAELAADLEQLRTVSLALRQQLLEGEPALDLRRHQRALEAAVQRRSRHALGGAEQRRREPPRLTALTERLQGRRLVSWFELDGALHALVAEASRRRVLRVAELSDVEFELRQLRMALRRAALGQPRAHEMWHASARRLDDLLSPALRPARRVSTTELVIVPTPALGALPWTLLDSVRGCTVELSASVTTWLQAASEVDPGGHAPLHRRHESRVVVVAGPDLPDAQAEAHAVAAGYPESTLLTGDAATSPAVLRQLDGADLAHLACHGSFRADNPQLSALRMADGPLTVYDLESLTKAPRHVVLSACDSGRTGTQAGAELLGLVAAFFRLGTRTLIASLLPVEDATTRELMTRLHTALRSGASAPEALRRAQSELVDARRDADVTAAAFVCFTG